jgi:Trypsin-like serine proteases, typically periplasmic, contain C-terminal PDZ domain
MRSIIFVIILLAVSSSLASAQLKPSSTSPFTWREAQASEDSELDRLNRAFVQLADHSRPAIVQIRVTTQDAKGNPAPPLGSRGSGFIIDAHGYILTAQHVVEKSKEIEIRLADSQRLPAQVIAADSQIDVAILKNHDRARVADFSVRQFRYDSRWRPGRRLRLSLRSRKLDELGNCQPFGAKLSRFGEL